MARSFQKLMNLDNKQKQGLAETTEWICNDQWEK